jgi:hypothetical protein
VGFALTNPGRDLLRERDRLRRSLERAASRRASLPAGSLVNPFTTHTPLVDDETLAFFACTCRNCLFGEAEARERLSLLDASSPSPRLRIVRGPGAAPCPDEA